MKKKGYFCVSLDFEMFWGMQDAVSLEDYGAYVINGKTEALRQLKLFADYGIHATWAAVGFLLARNKQELLGYLPARKPSYTLERRNPYRQFESLGENAEQSPQYYARELVDAIMQAPYQELGSHTFSHYYCTEPGQTLEEFAADTDAAVRIGTQTACAPRSLVFPRNQSADAYARVAAERGFVCYRGEEDNWIYRHVHKEFFLRALRFIDSYLPMSGHNCHPMQQRNGLVDIRGSAFFRPYVPKMRLLDGLKLARIKSQMRYAAKKGLVYHLYWHPHNLGMYAERTFAQQREIFAYFRKLSERYGFESKNMEELAQQFMQDEKVQHG